MRKDELIKNFNKILRTDPYILSLCESFGIELDSLDQLGEKTVNNMFFETMDEDLGIPTMAKTLDITFKENQTTEEKRSSIQAKWKSKGKCNEELLQAVCDSWKNGEITVSFVNSLIKVNFASIAGVPSDFENLSKAVNEVKPAYLIVDYIFNYLYWDLFESWNFTWNEFESKNLDWDTLELTIFKP